MTDRSRRSGLCRPRRWGRLGCGHPAADFDGDGELTIFDFLSYQNAFDAGCA